MVYSFQSKIKVKEPYLKLSASKKELAAGKSLAIKLKRYGTEEAVSWKVSNHTIASINEKTGKLYALKKGTVTVTAQSVGGRTAKLKIKVV